MVRKSLAVVQRIAGCLLSVAVSLAAADMRCWPEPKLDEVLAVLGPASGEERIKRAEHELSQNAFAAHWHFQSYLAYRALGEEATAAAELQRAIENHPDNSAYWGASAEFHYRQGDWVGGIKAAREQVRLDPGNPLGHCQLAVLLEMGDDVPEALAEFKACRQAANNLPSPSCNSVNYYGKKWKLTSNPKGFYFARERWDRNLAWSYPFGRLHLMAPVFDKPCAIAVAYPTNLNVGNSGSFTYGLEDFAKLATRRLGGTGRARPTKQSMSRQPFDRLMPHLGFGCPQPEQLRAVLGFAKENLRGTRNPVWAYWHAQAAWGHFVLGNEGEAFENIERGLRADPESLLLHLAGARIASRHNPDATDQILQSALRLEPGNPWVHFRLAEHYEQRGDFHSALTHYQHCLGTWRSPPESIVFSDDWKEIRATLPLRSEATRRIARLADSNPIVP
jgi:tetratricopeptide (TPR) repeat protein